MANREIKTTLKLEGEKEFKAAISDLNQEMAVYGSELREINSRYGENEKSMKKLSEQNKVLQNQYGVQKQKVETLKDAVSKSNEVYTQASLKYNEMVKAHGAESDQAKKAAEAVRKAEKSMNDFTIQLNNAEAGLNRSEKALKENEKEMKNLKNIKLSDIIPKEAAERVEKLAKGFKNAAEQAGKVAAVAGKLGMKTLSGSFSAAEKSLTAYAAAATAAAAAINKCTETYADFDDSMRQVAATMGISQEQIAQGSAKFEKLNNAAKDAGASTRYSASEAGDALNYLALAGYKADKAVETLPKVLNLAAAGNIDLAKASDMVTDSMSALGLSTSELDGFIDQMAKTSQKSNTSVEQLGEAILTAAGTAKSTGQELTTVNTALGVLADNGIKGTEGGTKLRNILLALAAPTDKAADKLKSLGVSVYDSSGNLMQLDKAMTKLNKSLDGLSQQERTDAINTIFNKTDISAVNALLSSTSGRFDKLSAAIENSAGAAAEMAGTMESGLAGSMRSFQSALEGMQIEVGAVFSDVKQSLLTNSTEIVRQFSQDLRDAGGDMEKIAEAVSKNISALVSSLAPQLEAAAPMLISGLNSLLNAVIKEIPNGASMLLPYLVDGLKSLALSLADSIPVLLPVVVQSGIDLFTGLIGGLNEVIAKLSPMLPTAVSDLMTVLVKDGLPLVISTSFELFIGLADGIAKAAPEIVDKIPELIAQITGPEGLSGHLPELIAAGMDIVAAVASGLPKAVPELIRALPTIVKAIVDGLADADWLGIGEDIITAVGEGLLAAAPALFEIAGSVAAGVLKIFTNLGDSIGKQYADNLNREVLEYIDEEEKFGSIQNDIIRRSNELMREGVESAEALKKAKEEILDTDEKLEYFEQNLADILTEQEAAGRYDTLKSTGQIGQPAASPTPKAASKNGMPSNIPTSSQAYDDKAAEYYEKLQSEGPAAAAKAYSAIAAAEKQGQSELDKVREEAAAKNVSDAKKQQDAETSAVKKSYEEQLSAMKKAQAEEEKSEKKFYDDSISYRKKQNDKLLTDRKRRYEDELEAFKKYQTTESAEIKKNYDNELARLDEKHSKKLNKIKQAYMDQLEYVDKEKYDALKAIEDEINAINGLTESENAALKAQAEQEKIRQLQQEISDAESSEERERAIKALYDYRAQLERERVLEERQNRVKELEEDKKKIEEKYKSDVETIENTYKDQVKADEEKYNEAVEKAKNRFDEEYNAAYKALKRRQEDELTAYKEELAQKVTDEEERDKALDAVKERHEKELDDLKEERDRRIDDLKEIHEQELEDLKSGNDKTMEYIAAQREKRLENLAEEKDQAIENAKAQSAAEIEEFKKTLLMKKELAAAAAVEMAVAAVGRFGAVEFGQVAVSGKEKSAAAGSTNITFNNYSPTEKTVYQQTRQNQQQLDIAKQYAQ